MRPAKYDEYARLHLLEFRNELRDEASRALQGWAGRSAVLLLGISSVMTYLALSAGDNPMARQALFAYAPVILLILLYPTLTLLASSLEKYAPQLIDVAAVSALLGFCVTLNAAFHPGMEPDAQARLHTELAGQINFVLLMTTAFAFHAHFRMTVLRNVLMTGAAVVAIYLVSPQYLADNRIQVIQGLMAGIMFAWVLYQRLQIRFYYKSTDADTRQHLYNQLSKLVYPHQLSMIKAGEELEATMPVTKGKAIINVFDIQRSSAIKHERTKVFFENCFRAFSRICMLDYRHNPLQARSFRLKETGDGFISAIGYPFLIPQDTTLANHAVETALMMFRAFNREVRQFEYQHPIKAAIGLAHNAVQGTFQTGDIKSYDLYGDALIQAYRYEELRKDPEIDRLIREKAAELGLEHYNILIIQDVIYNSLDERYRSLFHAIELAPINFRIRQDAEADHVYFHILE